MNIRYHAIYCLNKILNHHQKADMILQRRCNHANIDDRDRRLLCEMVLGVLRRYFTLEADVSRFVKRKPPEDARLALLVGAYQIRHMRVPTHAAVDETVEAVKALHPQATGMVNAVLRKVIANDVPKKLKPYQRAELPRWMYQTWRHTLGEDAVRDLSQALVSPAPLSIAVPNQRDAWLERVGQESVDVRKGQLSPHAVLLPMGEDVTNLVGFDAGEYWVMDQAAQLAVLALGDVSGLLLDMCSAPGGKAILASKLNSQVQVLAIEKTASRMPLMQENMQRMLAKDVCLLQADAFQVPLKDHTADAVLLDAPCTASGILRRHPDAKFLHDKSDVSKMAQVQKTMLKEAARVLKVGGRLVYAVCSVHVQENEGVVNTCESLGLKPMTFPEVFKAYEIDEGMARLLPSADHDGFFIAVMEKVKT